MHVHPLSAGFTGSVFPSDLLRFAIVANITSMSDSKLVNTVSTKVRQQADHDTLHTLKAFPNPQRAICAFTSITNGPCSSDSLSWDTRAGIGYGGLKWWAKRSLWRAGYHQKHTQNLDTIHTGGRPTIPIHCQTSREHPALFNG